MSEAPVEDEEREREPADRDAQSHRTQAGSNPWRSVRAGALPTTTAGRTQTKATLATPRKASRGIREYSARVKYAPSMFWALLSQNESDMVRTRML